MATIVNNKKYGDGHEVILRKLSANRTAEFKKLGYIPDKDVFKITRKASVKVDKVLDLKSGSDSITLIDKNNKILLIKGSSGSINGLFNHYTKNVKSLTGLLTQIKETYSLEMFKHYFERGKKILSEEDLNSLILKEIPKSKGNISSVYYTSAKSQLEALIRSKYVNGGKYSYERQGGKLTSKLYSTARKLTGKANDNWNPADVWMIRSGFDMNVLYESRTSSELNHLLAESFYNGDVIPISLKQVQSEKAHSSIIDPSKLLKSKIDLDFSFDRVDISNTFNNASILTGCGYTIRVGYKGSGGSINVSLEGSFKGVNYQLGAIDAKVYKEFIHDEFNYKLRSGNVNVADYDVAKKEFKTICSKYPRFSVSMRSFEDAMVIFDSGETLLKNRFSNLVSYVYSILILPKRFEDHAKFAYMLSKKITKDSGLYLLISE